MTGDSKLYNCLNTGAVSGSGSDVGSICGYLGSGTITNCYYLEGLTEDSNAAAKSAEELASGAVCWMLNGSSSTNAAWHQTIGEDSYPKPSGNSVVYYITFACDGSAIEPYYTNDARAKVHVFDETGFCTCGQYQPAERNSEGVYEIENAGQLFWFAALVNDNNIYAEFDAQDTAADAVLKNDIDMNNRTWTPIANLGNASDYYLGVFDGGGHTVSGLYVSGSRLGFFGYIGASGVVKSLTVEGSVSGGQSGGIASSNRGKITSCVDMMCVTARGGQGGVIVAYN